MTHSHGEAGRKFDMEIEAGQGSVVDRGKVGGIAKLGCHMKAFADGSMELFQFNKFSHKNQR